MLNLLKQDGFEFKFASSNRGGVYKGPCPKCGGDDRFSVMPDDGAKSGYICNQCNFHGDKISYLKEMRGMTYFQACDHIGIQPQFNYQSSRDLLNKENKIHEPKELNNPHQKWQSKSTALLHAFYKNMLSAPGKLIRDFLINEKFLKIETIQKARLGYNPTGMKFNNSIFGLPEDQEKKTVWIAQGVVIPYFSENKLIRLRVRQDNPSPGYGRYLMLQGSSYTFLIYPDYDINKPSVIVESELDGWLLWQECGDIINVMASGSSNIYPCVIAHRKIKESARVFVWGDNDAAGLKMNSWYEKQYKAIPMCQAIGEDPAKARLGGLNIREFIEGYINADDLPFLDSEEKTTENSDMTPTFDEISIKLPEKLQKIAEEIKTPEIHPEIKTEIVSSDECFSENKIDDRNCYGTGFCGRLKNNICLLNKECVYDLDNCPETPSRWKRWVDPSGAFDQIILEPSIKRTRR